MLKVASLDDARCLFNFARVQGGATTWGARTIDAHWRALRPHESVPSRRWPVGGGAGRQWEPSEGELGQRELPVRPRPCWRFELDRERNTAT